MKERSAVARGVLARLAMTAVLCAAVSMLFELAVAVLGVEDRGVASVVSLLVTIALLVVLVRQEVRAYRAIAACAPTAEISDRMLLGAALWFGGGLPQCLVSVARQLLGWSAVADPQVLYAQLGVSAALVVLAFLRFRRELSR